MTIHQCPKCELRFDWKTELDDHCWHDHPEFRHEYPASAPPRPVVDVPPASVPPTPNERTSLTANLAGWLVPAHEPEAPPRRSHLPATESNPDLPGEDAGATTLSGSDS